MLSNRYWIPKQEALKAGQAQLAHSVKALLKAGLQTVPSSYVHKLGGVIDSADLEGIRPARNSPWCTVLHDAQDVMYFIWNGKRLLEQKWPPIITKIFSNKVKKSLGAAAAKLCQDIVFTYADLRVVIAAKNVLMPLVRFHDGRYGGCVCDESPWDINPSFTDAGVTNWGYEKSFLIFYANKPLSMLAFYGAQQATLTVDPIQTLLHAEHMRARLPVMEKVSLVDSSKGHWDLFWPEGHAPDEHCYDPLTLSTPYVGRDPLEDVQHNSIVGIDFGTTSTVVAVREENRRIRLLRVGMQNLQQMPEARHYENPTVLELVDYKLLMEQWNAAPYRPCISWDDVRCSHQAKAAMCDAQAQVGVVRSGLMGIKTWARRKFDALPLRLRDQKGYDVELYSPLASMPTDVAAWYSGDTLNPIELYAYFLGLHLNSQVSFGGRIYTEYYLTFPVKFDRETRDRILKSFQRGLERSLPPSLAYSPKWSSDAFRVEEIGSEPTAYAAAALPVMQELAATPDGLPFGVFDFGGGTTDFSFGLYRTATPQEELDCGWGEVLEILDSAGDEQLGGEHLLHLMALQVMKDNVSTLLKCGTSGKPIPFVLPEGAVFHGCELLQDTTAIAQSNTTKLCEALRPLWEGGELPDAETGQIAMTLWDRDGTDVPECRLNATVEELRDILRERIRQGVKAFLAAFCQAFKINALNPQELHVLLAGNSCRSPLLREVFDQEIKQFVEEKPDVVRLHPPLLPQENNLDAPTLKTGVAIGLLKIAPGESIGVLERNKIGDETRFRFTVGRFRDGKLKPALIRNAPYGQWFLLGKVLQHGREVLGYSLLPQAIEEQIAEDDCLSLRHNFGKEQAGKYLYIRACGPDDVELGLAEEERAVDEHTCVRFTLKDV